ncbi:MAG: hypothetical protein ACREA0_00255 [bacterium]
MATTTLLEFLSGYGHVNDPASADRLKHLVRPPTWVRPRKAFIYVYGDPILAVMSLYRRGYAQIQARRNGRISTRPIPETVDDYARQGIDNLRLTRHLESWLHISGERPLVFVDSRRVWDNGSTLLGILGLDPSQLTFPERRPRASDLGVLSERTKRSLMSLYENYYALAEELPPVLGRSCDSA